MAGNPLANLAALVLGGLTGSGDGGSMNALSNNLIKFPIATYRFFKNGDCFFTFYFPVLLSTDWQQWQTINKLRSGGGISTSVSQQSQEMAVPKELHWMYHRKGRCQNCWNSVESSQLSSRFMDWFVCFQILDKLLCHDPYIQLRRSRE